MLDRVLSAWRWFRSDRPGFSSGISLLITFMLLIYYGGIQASLSLGPGGNFPRVKDVFLYALSHDDLPSLLVSVVLLLLFGQYQERRWGTVTFLALSILTMTALPLLYTLVLFVLGAEASRIYGFSAVQLALFTAHSRQVTQKKLLRCLPVWILPWLLLLIGLLLLPGTPALLHFCAICIGHNYNLPFIKVIQELEEATIVDFIPLWAYIPSSSRIRLPTYISSQRSRSPPVIATPCMRDPSVLTQRPWADTAATWVMDNTLASQSEAEVLEEQMLRAGILASLQDAPDNPDTKVELQKSSVSSLRLQQLEKMGFPTEKAVVALAASKQLDGAISLLIDDSVGKQAVVVSKGKTTQPLNNS